MAAPTLYQKRVAAKRSTADITRLSEQYKTGIETVTSEYEQAFKKFERQREEFMAPFEAARRTYVETTLPEYERAAAAYQQRISQYQESLRNYEEYVKKIPEFYYGATNESRTPYTIRFRPDRYGGAYTAYEGFDPLNPGQLRGTPVASWLPGIRPIPSGYEFVQTSTVPVYGERGTFAAGYFRKSGAPALGSVTMPGAFTEPMPTAPEAPRMPTQEEMPQFAEEPFQQRRVELETQLQREIGERRAARMSAVSRRGARPLMQGA